MDRVGNAPTTSRMSSERSASELQTQSVRTEAEHFTVLRSRIKKIGEARNCIGALLGHSET